MSKCSSLEESSTSLIVDSVFINSVSRLGRKLAGIESSAFPPTIFLATLGSCVCTVLVCEFHFSLVTARPGRLRLDSDTFTDTAKEPEPDGARIAAYRTGGSLSTVPRDELVPERERPDSGPGNASVEVERYTRSNCSGGLDLKEAR